MLARASAGGRWREASWAPGRDQALGTLRPVSSMSSEGRVFVWGRKCKVTVAGLHQRSSVQGQTDRQDPALDRGSLAHLLENKCLSDSQSGWLLRGPQDQAERCPAAVTAAGPPPGRSGRGSRGVPKGDAGRPVPRSAASAPRAWPFRRAQPEVLPPRAVSDRKAETTPGCSGLQAAAVRLCGSCAGPVARPSGARAACAPRASVGLALRELLPVGERRK